MTGVCARTGCDRPAQCTAATERVCLMHYKRFARHGDFEVRQVWVKPREQRGTCTVAGCENVDEGQAGLCKKHASRVRVHGNPHVVLPRPVMAGPESPTWSGEGASYNAVHLRLKQARGRASQQTCGCGAQAAHWAYDHRDLAERTSEHGPYSVDLNHYIAMCVPCHKRADLDHLARVS